MKEVRDAADSLAYKRGVNAERERLKALDDIAGAGRGEIIARAKYEDPKDARDVAMELLQASSNAKALDDRQEDASVVNIVLRPANGKSTAREQEEEMTDKIAKAINEMRWYRG